MPIIVNNLHHPMADLYVDTPQTLVNLYEQLRGNSWIALDTEFIRERTYYPQLCLIQIANEELVACVDPLLLDNLDPLLEILHDPTITKVLHAAYQDLEIFFHRYGKVPAPVFDTQIAAALLGQGDQVGYATLVKQLLDIELDKSQTRTDWSRRPLQPAQLSYAADDVRYLRDIYLDQQKRLQSGDRLVWLRNDFKELCDPEHYRVHPQKVWRRIRGSHQLRGVQLPVLRALAAWRETQAIQSNRPRRWVLGDDVLVNLARCMPENWEALKRVKRLEAGQLRRYGQELLKIIDTSRLEPRENWPILAMRQHLSFEQEALVDAMMAVVRLRGGQKSISPQTLANRQDLERLLSGDQEIPLLRGWRFMLAGRDVQALLRGDIRLEVRNKTLDIQSNA